MTRAMHKQGTQSRLVVIANALPVRLHKDGDQTRWRTSPGGLVSALAPVVREEGGAWLGWTGEVDRARAPFEHDGITNVPVEMSAADVRDAYEGACNRMLWPLYHEAVRQPEYHRRWWRRYEAVNERFAERALTLARRGAWVWVHDYHLQLVPAMLRRRRPDLRIGFFLHIPFPPEDLYVRLPWRRAIVEGVLGADVIGFQTPADVRNFARVAARLSGVARSRSHLNVGGRRVLLKAYPIGIDTPRYEATAREGGVLARAAAIRDRLGRGRTIFLGVDRLDYTKGIDVRLKAFQQLLENRPAAAREAAFVQVAVPSRERIAEYRALRRTVEELVGQINGQYAEVGAPVVHYVRRTLPFEELIAMYRAAQVMVVTPLCDGMNLVAKEYVAARYDDTGVLILSEFAGAAAELSDALLVNPHDVDGMAEAMARALTLPRDEAVRRMRRMRRTVRRHTVQRWADRFLGDLRAAGSA